MKGLLIKDVLTLKNQGKLFLVIIVFYGFFAATMGDPGFVNGMIVLVSSMMFLTSFAYDDLAKWDALALSMPITRKNLVSSKYILSILLAVLGGIVAVLFNVGFYLLDNRIDLAGQMTSVAGIVAIAITFCMILLPIIFKFGVEKSRFLMMAILLVPIVIVFLLDKAGISMPTAEQLNKLLLFSPFLLVALVLISWVISCNIFMRKEI